MARKWRVFLILLPLGLALTGGGVLLHRLAPASANMPPGSDLASKDGKYYFARPDAPPGVVDEKDLVPVTEGRFHRRMAVDGLASVAFAGGLVLLWLLGTGMGLKGVAESNPHLVPKNPEDRWILALSIMTVFAMFAIGMMTRFVVARGLSGTGWQTQLDKTAEGRFAVHHRIGQPGSIRVPISEEQYQRRESYETLGTVLGILGGAGVACVFLAMGVLQLAGKLTCF